MSRVSYFKNVSPSVGLDATQNQMLNTLSGQIASKADLTALTSGLAQKADISALNSGLALKANCTDLDIIVSSLDQSIIDAQNAIDTKLNISVYDARVVNEAVFFDSVANSIVLQDASGVELNYVALGLVPQ
jgi:hypothetical protein